MTCPATVPPEASPEPVPPSLEDLTPAERVTYRGLPGGFFGALGRVGARTLCFYPGLTLAATTGCLWVEGAAWGSMFWTGLLAGGFLWPALYGIEAAAAQDGRSAGPLDALVDVEVHGSGLGGPEHEANDGPLDWLFRGCNAVASALVEGLGTFAGEGLFAGLGELVAVFGVTLVLMAGAVLSAIAASPFLVVLWAPSWLRLGVVLAPLFPVTGLFALVAWVRLRRRMRARDAALAALAAS